MRRARVDEKRAQKLALSATPNPYRDRLKNRGVSGVILRLTFGVFSPFRAALRGTFSALSSFAES